MQHVFDTFTGESSTLTNYENNYLRVWAKFANRDITTLLKSELQKRLAEFDYMPRTQRSVISILRLAFEAARDDGVEFQGGRLPTDSWKTGKQQRRAKQPYTADQRNALLDELKTLDTTAWRFITLGFYTGMRTEELLAIQKEHLRKPKIHVNQVRTAGRLEERTKTHISRDIHVPRQIWADVIAPYRFQEWLFVGQKGKPFTTANKIMEQFQKAHDNTGIERPKTRKGRPMPYPWRNTYASIALQSGVRPQLVADQLGNDLKTMLEYYAEFMPRDDDSQEIERAFGEANS